MGLRMNARSEAIKNATDDRKASVPDQEHTSSLLAYFCESMGDSSVSTEKKGCQNLIAFRRDAKS